MNPPNQTWDGKAVAPDPPFGASVIVYREVAGALEFLLLHRSHNGSAFEGDWAWTPPSGARYPGEAIEECARRELREETGLDLPIVAVNDSDERWAVFVASAGMSQDIRLDAEHDRWVWADLETALARIKPDGAREGIQRSIAHLREK